MILFKLMREGKEIQDYNLRLIIGLHSSKAGVKYKKVYKIMNLLHFWIRKLISGINLFDSKQ